MRLPALRFVHYLLGPYVSRAGPTRQEEVGRGTAVGGWFVGFSVSRGGRSPTGSGGIAVVGFLLWPAAGLNYVATSQRKFTVGRGT